MQVFPELIELVTVVGTLAFLAIVGFVLIIVLISIIDRHPGKKSGRAKNVAEPIDPPPF